MCIRTLTTLAALGMMLLLTACQPLNDYFEGDEPLVGPVWQLVQMDGNPPVPGTTVTAEFGEAGKMGGTAGCNNYGAPYAAGQQEISIGPVMSTQMMCLEPVMDQEINYLAALQAAATFEIAGDQLTLMDGDGTVIAVFAALDQSLAGSSWDVTSYNNGREAVVSVILGTGITAEFGDTGQVTGNAGCNHYFGPYETEENSISMGPFGMTEMACPEPDGVMDQEVAYLAALQTAATYKIEGNRMEMRTGEGSLVATFSRALEGRKEEAAVTGAVNYRQRIALPEDAVVTVRVQDTSLADAPSKVMGEQVIPAEGKQVPIPYSVAYDPAEIDERNSYTVSARIEDGAGKLLYISDTAVAVITRGNPTKDVEIVVVDAGSP